MSGVRDYLTRRQKEILDFIAEFRRGEGVSPTHREICKKFGYSSYGTVYKHLKLLEEKGYLSRHWNQKRGIQLLRWPPSTGKKTARSTLRDLPFFGLIAAGKPIEAVEGNDRLSVPEHLLGQRHQKHFVLKVVGDSMIDEGIHDGDLVVVERRDKAESGEMVVALIDDEATLKRFYPEGKQIRLQPANPNMKPFFVAANDVMVQGLASCGSSEVVGRRPPTSELLSFFRDLSPRSHPGGKPPSPPPFVYGGFSPNPPQPPAHAAPALLFMGTSRRGPLNRKNVVFRFSPLRRPTQAVGLAQRAHALRSAAALPPTRREAARSQWSIPDSSTESRAQRGARTNKTLHQRVRLSRAVA